MSVIKYFKIWPGGNTTALVEQVVLKREIPKISKLIMNLNKEIEQVGFFKKTKNSKTKFKLEMMGGEFCGNAARAAAFLYHKRFGLKKIFFEVSGFKDKVFAEIIKDGVRLGLSSFFCKKITIKPWGGVVDLSGIRHLIVKESFEDLSIFEPYKKGVLAMGVILVSEKNEDVFKIDPLVWVRGTNSFVKETACASGSIAAALYIKNVLSPKKTDFLIEQPSEVQFLVRLPKNKAGKIYLESATEFQGEGEINFV